ncbi:ChuX/HutX family heme-like substrate-binding protein [Rhodobacter capsulatus]|uniref:ChuX/HutX family heme-like substrate-binding protein n=1 Tax=Rhodobacter capsulatus TaxID=1061 RepID=UPI0040283D9F
MTMTPEQIRTARAKKPRVYARDFAEDLGITEAALCAAFVGVTGTRIVADPDRIMPGLAALGQVMALTRNDSCVLEKVGCYDQYQSGDSPRIVNPPIEIEMFRPHWQHAFAFDEATPKGPKRSIQIFDTAGEAVHKIHLRTETNASAWAPLIASLRIEDQSQSFDPSPAGHSVDGWGDLSRLADLRLGNTPARHLSKGSVERLMYRAAELAVPVQFAVGNPGCIERHSGLIVRVLETGPWINVLDPGLELHLRMDHMAEVWAHPDGSVDAFGEAGQLIVRMSGAEGWADLLAAEGDFQP